MRKMMLSFASFHGSLLKHIESWHFFKALVSPYQFVSKEFMKLLSSKSKITPLLQCVGESIFSTTSICYIWNCHCKVKFKKQMKSRPWLQLSFSLYPAMSSGHLCQNRWKGGSRVMIQAPALWICVQCWCIHRRAGLGFQCHINLLV